MQERPRACGNQNVLAVARDVEPIERAQRRFRLALRGTECCEIVPAGKMPRRLLHGSGVERHGNLPGPVPVQRQSRAPVHDAVEVMTRLGREPRVEGFRDDLAVENGDRLGFQMEVERVANRFGRVVPGEIDMRHLTARVNAGIGAPGAFRHNAAAAQSLDSARKLALIDGPFAWICHPAKGVPSYSMVSL